MARWWARLILTYPRAVLLLAGLLAFLSLLAAVRWLDIRPSRSELVFSGERLSRLRQRYEAEFGQRDGIVVVVDASDLPRAKQFVTALAARLERETEYIGEPFYRVDAAAVKDQFLQYLSLAELESLRRKIEDHHAFLQDLTSAPGLTRLFAGLDREIGRAALEHIFTGFLVGKQSVQADLALLNAQLRQMITWLSGSRAFSSPWQEWLGIDAAPAAGEYLLTEDRRYLLLLAETRARAGRTLVPKQESIERVRTAIADLRRDFPRIDAGVTGADALESDEIVAAKRDATIATMLALVGVALLFLFFWRGLGALLRAFLSLAVGISWAMGFTVLAIGSLNIMTAMFTPILIGLGIDFNIHILERYAEERRRGAAAPEALEETFRRAGGSIAIAAVTTAMAFYALLLTDFKGLMELGLITGSGVLLCLAAAFTVLPALLIGRERRAPVWVAPRSTFFLEALERWNRHPRLIIAGAGLLVALSFLALGEIELEFNLLKLQAEGTESVQWERRLLAGGGTSTWHGIVLARSPDEAKTKAAALKALPTADRVQTIYSFLPDQASRKAAAIRSLKTPLGGLPATIGPLRPVNLEELRTSVGRLRSRLGHRESLAAASNLGVDLEDVRRRAEVLQAKLHEGDRAEVTAALAAYQAELFADLEQKIRLLRDNLGAGPMSVTDLPAPLRERFIGTRGSFLVKVIPRGDIWAREPLRNFVREVRSVDPDAIGDPIIVWEHGRSMEKGYLIAGLYAAIGVVVVIMSSFGRVGHSLLALLPLVMGAAWTIGLMGLFGINFNLLNLIILPLTAGYGIMNGLHIVKRWLQEGEREPIIANSTGRAVFLSASTTMVGFGSLMVASHRGVFSLGFLLSVGIGSILLVSLTVLPAVLQIFSATRTARQPERAQ